MGLELIIPIDELTNISTKPCLHRLLKHFDVDFYRTHLHDGNVADLIHLSNQEAYQHFIYQGWREQRMYNRFFYAFIEPSFYRQKYPELNLSSDSEAIVHWMYEGVFENKIPNSVTQDYLDAKIHLFQMGKVGSKSLELAIQETDYSQFIPHIHWANDLLFSAPDCFLSYLEIINTPPEKEIIFISGIREPIERVLSGFIQALSEKKSSLTEADVMSLITYNVDKLESFFAPHIKKIIDWFDHHYYRGLNPYLYDFDINAGFCEIIQGNTKVFIYRLDRIDDAWQPLSILLNLELAPKKINVTADKKSLQLFLELKNHLRFSENFVNNIIASPYCQHFFSANEHQQMLSRWVKIEA